MISELIEELKIKIIDTLNLIDVVPAEIDADEPLVGGRLGIDSIDVLEMVMMIEKDYLIRIDNKELGEKIFGSIRSMANYIAENSANFSVKPSQYGDAAKQETAAGHIAASAISTLLN